MALLLLLLLGQTTGPSSASSSIYGVYNGTYVCFDGATRFKLSLSAASDGSLTGVFTEYPALLAPREFTYSLFGMYEPNSKRFQLGPIKWDTQPPPKPGMVGLTGSFDPAAGGGNGQVTGVAPFPGCTTFSAIRDSTESAAITNVIAAQRAGRTGGPPAIAQAIPRPAPAPAVKLPATSAQPSTTTASTAAPSATRAAPVNPAPSAAPKPKPAAPAPGAFDKLDPSWMKDLDLEEPVFVRALYMGDLAPLSASRPRALAYVGNMSGEFSEICPDVFPSTLMDQAMGQLMGPAFQQWRNGDLGSLLGTNLAVTGVAESAARDAHTVGEEILYEIFSDDPADICDDPIASRIAETMTRFVANPGAAATPAAPARPTAPAAPPAPQTPTRRVRPAQPATTPGPAGSRVK